MPSPIIHIQGLSKLYGRIRGIEDLNLSIPAGSIFGFLGPNGAGKTTTIRLLLDFIKPTAGRVEVFGLDTRRDGRSVRRRIGYVASEPLAFEDLTGRSFLAFCHHLADRPASYETFADRLGLALTRPIGQLSHGNRQKLALVRALMTTPDLLILDEPTNSLDPLVQQEVHHILREVREAGRTVFISSHNLTEVERLCDQVAIIRQGRLVAVEEVAQLKAKMLRRLELTCAAPIDADVFRNLPSVEDVAQDGNTAILAVRGPLGPILEAAASCHIVDLTVREASLENLFYDFYRADEDHAD